MKKNDIKLIIGIIIVALAIIICRQLTRSHGAQAVVYIDGKESARYSLDTDHIY